MVSRFQLVFFGSTNVFPVNPIPPSSMIVAGRTDDHLEIAGEIGGKPWRLVGQDSLPIRFQQDPFHVFQLLNLAGRLYYLPAFLRMCEREPEGVGRLPENLLVEFTSDSTLANDLRSRLNDEQKRCILVFFEEWFKNNSDKAASLNDLRKRCAAQTEGPRCGAGTGR